MYEIVIQNYVNNIRQADSIFMKKYAREGNAERKAKELTQRINDTSYTKAYVRQNLVIVNENVAKAAYCNSRPVYVDTIFGHEKLTESWRYGSHASALELFYRSLTAIVGWEKQYQGNFYIEENAVSYVEQRIKDGYGFR